MNPINSKEDEEKYNSKEILNLKESSSSSSSEKNSNSDVESLTDSIDEERLTLGQINKIMRKAQQKKEKMDLVSFLKNKRKYEGNVITYDEKKGKILKEFCGNIEELNDFLSKCEVKKINIEDDINNLKNNNSIVFDPNEWMKKNNIIQKTISLEDFKTF